MYIYLYIYIHIWNVTFRVNAVFAVSYNEHGRARGVKSPLVESEMLHHMRGSAITWLSYLC